MVQDDYVGGGGSRGNGQIRFAIKSIKERAIEYYTKERIEKDISDIIPDELK
jgi:CRISPR/Cas system CSM-associated protein Csm3 (group 7 of RAMP superfamily)